MLSPVAHPQAQKLAHWTKAHSTGPLDKGPLLMCDMSAPLLLAGGCQPSCMQAHVARVRGDRPWWNL